MIDEEYKQKLQGFENEIIALLGRGLEYKEVKAVIMLVVARLVYNYSKMDGMVPFIVKEDFKQTLAMAIDASVDRAVQEKTQN